MELDEGWFNDLALKTRATLAVLGPRGVMRSQGPTAVVAPLIDRLGQPGAPPHFTDVEAGTAGARVDLNGNLALLAMAAESNEVRVIEQRYSHARLIILAGSGASLTLPGAEGDWARTFRSPLTSTSKLIRRVCGRVPGSRSKV